MPFAVRIAVISAITGAGCVAVRDRTTAERREGSVTIAHE